MLRDADDALRLLRQRRVLTLVPIGDLPSVVGEVCGGRVRGSWWAHPKGRIVYAVSSALEDSPDVLAAKLVQGKVTFVHRALWPALVRFATDRRRRAGLLPALGATARRLLAEVERRGEVRFAGRAPPDPSARAALEARWLCVSTSEHTASGRHAAVLRSWRRWAGRDVLCAAAAIDRSAARAALLEACGGLGDADVAAPAPPAPRSHRSTRRVEAGVLPKS
jgi:hypothetical protein